MGEEELPSVITSQMAALRTFPGRWCAVLGLPDAQTAGELAGRLGAHPGCKGFAWAVRGSELWGAYFGVTT